MNFTKEQSDIILFGLKVLEDLIKKNNRILVHDKDLKTGEVIQQIRQKMTNQTDVNFSQNFNEILIKASEGYQKDLVNILEDTLQTVKNFDINFRTNDSGERLDQLVSNNVENIQDIVSKLLEISETELKILEVTDPENSEKIKIAESFPFC